MNIYPISEITMTIFPELTNPIDNPPLVMSCYPYFSDTEVKVRVIELVSGMFEDSMGELFSLSKLRRFLTDNRNNFYNMVEDTMQEYNYDLEEDTDRLLGELIMDMFNEYIDIEDWIEIQKELLFNDDSHF